MKYSQLSNFQKQQYTNYLQTQLQKFSSFMLAQKRENDKYRLLEDAITYQSSTINQMQEKMQLMELYQRQNQDSFEHSLKKTNRIDDIEAKIHRLEDRQRFGCDDKSNIKSRMNQKMHHNSNNQEQEVDHSIIIEASYKDCMKMIKRQQAELSDCQDVIRKINPQDVVERKDLKKMQKKMIRYINEKMEQIESKRYRSRSRSKSSKSRSARAGQLSIIDNYTIKQSKKAISSFRIEEDVANKSQVSTILESKSTKKSRISQKGTNNKMKKKSTSKSISKKKKNRSKSKNRSRSKSKSNDKKQSKANGRNKSRSVQARNKSFSHTDESIIYSSKSRSHSKISKHQRSKSKDSNISKHSKHTKNSKKMKKSQSKQKSHSNSHDLCKKRPQQILNLPKRIQQIKKQTVPLRKRKPLQGQRYK